MSEIFMFTFLFPGFDGINFRCAYLCWVVFEVFIIIKQICLFLIRLLSKVAGKGNTAEISVFYSGRHDTVILTPLPRTGMFSKNWRAILVEVAGPKAPHWMSSKPYISFEQSYIFTKLHPQEGMSYNWLVEWNLQAPPLTTLSLSKIF